MISLPPGVTINYNIKIIINDLSIEVFEWLRDVGARVWVEGKDYDKRGWLVERPMIQFGNSKPSYYLQDGTGNVMLNFNSGDAGTALAFLLKYNDQIVSHNMKEAEKYVY
jgi:hypothetical protein